MTHMKKVIKIKSAILLATMLAVPTVALAAPTLSLGYDNVGISGHSSRPGVSLLVANIYSNNVVAMGGVSVANNYYNVHADIGDIIPADSNSLYFDPYVSAGFINMNYSAPSYSLAKSTQDFYGLAGANVAVPVSNRVLLQVGGGFGHTITTFGGGGGTVYKGLVGASFYISSRVEADLDVTYMHLPNSPSLTNYGAGITYMF